MVRGLSAGRRAAAAARQIAGDDGLDSAQAVAPSGGGPDGSGANRASCLASTLAASLELVKEGALEARQLEAFSDLYLRARPLRLEVE